MLNSVLPFHPKDLRVGEKCVHQSSLPDLTLHCNTLGINDGGGEIITPTLLCHLESDFHFKQLMEQQCGHQKACEGDPPAPALLFFKIIPNIYISEARDWWCGGTSLLFRKSMQIEVA